MRALILGWAVGSVVVGVGLAAVGCLFPSFSDLSACANGCGGASGASATSGVGSGESPASSGSGKSGAGGAASSSATGMSTSTSAGAGGNDGGVKAPCALANGMHGPKGIHITPSFGFPDFCVDETEVSVGEYRAFEEGNIFPLPAGDFPAQCAWKANDRNAFLPADNIWHHYDAKDLEDRPVFGIDWCDAAIFCRWAGKRLCGAEDPANRHMDATKQNWEKTGEWYRACGGPKGWDWGYGSMPMPNKCNDSGGTEADAGPNEAYYGTTDVTKPATCVAQWPEGQVYDMNGNVAEWEDDCKDGSGATVDKDACYPRGGPFNSIPDYTNCSRADPSGYTRSTKAYYTGFRCCW